MDNNNNSWNRDMPPSLINYMRNLAGLKNRVTDRVPDDIISRGLSQYTDTPSRFGTSEPSTHLEFMKKTMEPDYFPSFAFKLGKEDTPTPNETYGEGNKPGDPMRNLYNEISGNTELARALAIADLEYKIHTLKKVPEERNKQLNKLKM